MKTSDFIREATEIHNGRYKYIIDTDTVYAKENIIAICPIHGAFKTNVYEKILLNLVFSSFGIGGVISANAINITINVDHPENVDIQVNYAKY